ncbi:MAG TPA: TROVE domain-containing protein [Caldilineaceae bacterium]|nr:TROVE domain-containing protein [Caldilineaceae bacterium]
MYLRKPYNKQRTHQSMPIPGANQVPNSAGGFAWAVDDWARLDRFLILGAEGGTYYSGEQQLTLENAAAVCRCIDQDGVRVVARVVAVSESGRAPKNDPALFVLALAAGKGNPVTRQAALDALPGVARTGTHLFHFLAFVENFRGWGRGLRRAVAAWYNAMPLDRLAYQAIKYQQRDGWSHRDALRLAHPRADHEQRNALYRWIVRGWPLTDETLRREDALPIVWAFEQARFAQDEQTIIGLLTKFGLPWEALPTQWLGHAEVWRALLPQLPLTALLRNLARMTANGLLTAQSQPVEQVIQRLENAQQIRQARIHPLAVLAAMQTYARGRGMRGQGKWQPVDEIVAALDRAFYLSFGNVTPTGKRIVLALDVSASMEAGAVGGVVGLTPRIASAAMGLITAATEPQHQIIAFAHQMQPLDIRPRQRLDVKRQ